MFHCSRSTACSPRSPSRRRARRATCSERALQRTAALAVTLALSGCVTGAGIWKRDTSDGVTLPLLLGAVAADLVVTGAIASQVQDFTVAASIGTALAVTAADFGVGCLIGACTSLRL